MMKRLILVAALAAGSTLTVVAEGAIPQPIYFWGNVAATVSAPGQPSALPEVIRPPAILLAADGSADVEHLHWTGWGSSVAHANGISSASNGIPNMAHGKRIKSPAQVTLSNPVVRAVSSVRFVYFVNGATDSTAATIARPASYR
jgi:hypothetical protein